MADLYWIEGCEGHGTSGAGFGLPEKYTGPNSSFVGGVNVIAGKNVGKAWHIIDETRIQTPDIMNTAEATMGFWFRQTQNSVGTDFIASLWKASGVVNAVSLTQNGGGGISTGSLFLRVGFTNVGTSTGFSPVLNTWYYIHLYCLIGTSGILRAYVDGVEIAEFLGDTTQGGANFHYAGFHSFDHEYDIDDLYVAEGDFRVEPEIHTLMPDINGSVIQFTSSSGPNNNTVDDDPTDDDSTYNESDSSGNRDLFNLFDLSSTLGIIGMQLNSRSKAITANHNIKLVTKSGIGEDVSGDFEVGTTYEHQYHINQIDPNTSASWLKAGFNAAEFGYEDGGSA